MPSTLIIIKGKNIVVHELEDRLEGSISTMICRCIDPKKKILPRMKKK